MRFILRDWDRIWYLAFSHEAGRCPGTPITDVRSAQSTLSHLFRNPLNIAVARSWLASELAPGARAIPAQSGPLLTELRRRLEQRACALVRGAPYALRSGRKSGPDAAGGTRTMEVWEFVPEDGAAEESPKEAEDIPVLRFSGGFEAPMALLFAHGSERQPGMAFEHNSENGAVFGFTGAAESPHGLEHSAAVKAPA